MAACCRAALIVTALAACARPARTTPATAATPVPASAPAAGLKEWTLMKNGGSMMRLVGDPYKAERFAIPVRYPADMKTDSAPHYHMGTEHVTILAGTLVLGFGDHVDVTKTTEYGPGSFIVIPAGVHHYEWFKGETMSHVEGFGPMGTIRLDRPDSTHPPAVPASH